MRFPDTSHSAILGLHDEDDSIRRQSYESVIGAYWQPVHKYLCFGWRETDQEGADLTQAFFSNAMESGTLTSYDPAKGTFRTYLRTCIDRFVLNVRKRASRAELLPLDFDVAAETPAPEEVFRREWIRSLFSLALQDLRSSCDNLRFQVFERYDLNESCARPTYAELAAQFDLSTATITNYLAAARRDFRRALLERLRELTATEREFRSEARDIFGVEI